MPEGKSDSNTGAGNQAPAAGAAVNPGNAVFISYASQDTAVADALCAAVERAGIACWIAPRNVTPGEFYADAIVQAINACRVLVLVLSENSINSPHVVREVERASAKHRPVISFRIDLTPLPPGLEYFLSASHWLDASAGAEAAFPKLIEAVRGRMASGPADGLTLASAAADTSKQSAQAAAVKSAADESQGSLRSAAAAPPKRRIIAWLAALAVAAGLAYVAVDKFQASKHRAADAQSGSGTPAAPEAVAPIAATSEQSIAVLPFADMSEKKDQEYFSDGLAEELIGLLAKIPGLHVPARTSSFYFKGKQTTIAEIAKALGVANVLEGSVRKSGNTLRITAQLIRADNGYDVWSETYDRQLDDIFKVQDEIAGAVVKALKVSLMGAAPQTTAPTQNSDAYALYLKAKDLHLRGSEADENQAGDDLQQALKLDPKFALAWAMLASVRSTSYAYFTRPYEKSRTDALYAATQALQLDPNLSIAHAELARVRLIFDWDWSGSEAENRKALELDPTNAHVITATAFSECYAGRFEEALRLAGISLARDPLDPLTYQIIANVDYRLGRYPQAEAALRRQIELYPNAPGVHYRLALVQVAQGQAAASLETMQNEPDLGYRRVGLPLTLDAAGRKSDADAAIAQLDKIPSVDSSWSYQMALTYAHRHDVERALVSLDRAYVNRDSGLLSIVGEPLFKPLKSEPRYQALLRKLKLPG